jgi:hypothetical protein
MLPGAALKNFLYRVDGKAGLLSDANATKTALRVQAKNF